MKFHFFYLFFFLILTGCAQIPKSELPSNNSWEFNQTQVKKLTDWSFSGKLGIFTSEGRDSVNIHWQQTLTGFHIRLNGPLGINILDVQKMGNNTLIIDGKEYISNDPEQLITELSGMVLPIEQLQQWIKGNPSAANYQLDSNQKLTSLIGGQLSTGFWLINYSDYRTINDIDLPHNLQLTRGDLRLKFRISSWEIPEKN